MFSYCCHNKSGKRSHFKSLAILFPIFMLIFSCRGNEQHMDKVTTRSDMINDSSYIFNGKNLDGWEITDFGPQGPVSVSDGEVILGMGEGCTGITWKRSFPADNYIVTLDARRVAGTDFFCGMTFPVKESFCTLIVGGWGGAVVGLSSINGVDASENETRLIRNFETGRWYHISLRVENDSIIAAIDAKAVINFKIGNNRLSLRPEVRLSKPFGIASWTTTSELKNIRLQYIK